MSKLTDLVTSWIENTDSKRTQPVHERSIKYDPNSVSYFPEGKLLGVNAASSRWGGIPGLRGYDIFNYFWDSGALTVYREVSKTINEDIPGETMKGFVPLSSKYIHNAIWVGPARVLISQVLQLEKEYPELGTSAKNAVEAWAIMGNDAKSFERAYNAEMRAELDPVFQTLGDIGKLSAKSLYKFLDDFSSTFPDDGQFPDIEQLRKLGTSIEQLAYQPPEFVQKRNDALERLQDVVKNSSDLPEEVTPEHILNGDYPLSNVIERSVRFAEYCKADKDLCFLMMFNRFLTTYSRLTSLKVSALQHPQVEEGQTGLQKALGEKDARIAELENQLAAAAEPVTTVNATRWGNSVTAAFRVWADIIAGDKTDWKEDEFRKALTKYYNDYLTDVHATAWRLLPEDFKHGRGRPKNNPEKSQQSDNS